MYTILFPGGKRKVVTFSYDDGTVHDRRLVALFNRYGLKGTFHLNSGRMDILEYIDSAEVAVLYSGHEVSCHGVQHRWLNQISRAEIVQELLEDRRGLERLTDGIVTGLSYAFGAYNDEIIGIARTLGIEYARTVKATEEFFAPEDFMRWHPTCHHNALLQDMTLVEKFLHPPAYLKPELFYIWGHSYEFERDDSWDAMERLCASLSGHDDIWYATNLEYCRYYHAAQSLAFSADLHRVGNPTGVPIWIEREGTVITVEPGMTR